MSDKERELVEYFIKIVEETPSLHEKWINPPIKITTWKHLLEQDKEIERLNKIINSFLAYLKGNEEHWKDTSYNWDSLIYGELAQRLEMKIKMSLEESDKE